MTNTEKRFWGLIKIDNTASGDVERYQLFYTIARTEELWLVVDRIYDVKEHCLIEGWDNLFDNTFGKMLQRAAHLYNSNNDDINTVKLFWGMDAHNKETMANAQLMYLGLFDFSKDMYQQKGNLMRYSRNYIKKMLEDPLPPLPEDERIYLNVPYKAREFAKYSHCGFDPDRKLWFTGALNANLYALVEL